MEMVCTPPRLSCLAIDLRLYLPAFFELSTTAGQTISLILRLISEPFAAAEQTLAVTHQNAQLGGIAHSEMTLDVVHAAGDMQAGASRASELFQALEGLVPLLATLNTVSEACPPLIFVGSFSLIMAQIHPVARVAWLLVSALLQVSFTPYTPCLLLTCAILSAHGRGCQNG